jgi:hypothetical protein
MLFSSLVTTMSLYLRLSTSNRTSSWESTCYFENSVIPGTKSTSMLSFFPDHTCRLAMMRNSHKRTLDQLVWCGALHPAGNGSRIPGRTNLLAGGGTLRYRIEKRSPRLSNIKTSCKLQVQPCKGGVGVRRVCEPMREKVIILLKHCPGRHIPACPVFLMM